MYIIDEINKEELFLKENNLFILILLNVKNNISKNLSRILNKLNFTQLWLFWSSISLTIKWIIIISLGKEYLFLTNWMVSNSLSKEQSVVDETEWYNLNRYIYFIRYKDNIPLSSVNNELLTIFKDEIDDWLLSIQKVNNNQSGNANTQKELTPKSEINVEDKMTQENFDNVLENELINSILDSSDIFTNLDIDQSFIPIFFILINYKKLLTIKNNITKKIINLLSKLNITQLWIIWTIIVTSIKWSIIIYFGLEHSYLKN